jgi:TolB-like protein/tetratricopeptide (TPR) repeat protein/predicted Ser/Thr protein kinase
MTSPRSTLGGYRIDRPLGRGGMGAVFLAYDTTLQRPVALKVMDQESDDGTSHERLLKEARNAAALNHPHICTIHEVGQDEGTAFIAMEYVEGRSLGERLDETGALPTDEVLRYGIQAADALAYAHERGVIHRDLKAANAMVTTDGRLKIVDFGLARRLDARLTDATTYESLVPAGVVAGTPYSMAPEQVRGDAADPRTDVWALGVMLHEMATGRRPFDAPTTADLFAAILKETPARWPPGHASAALAPVVARCLEKDPARRYANAGEVRLALETVQAGVVPAAASPRRRRVTSPRLLATAVVVTAALAVGANVGGLRDRIAGLAPSPPSIKLAVLPFDNLTGDAEQAFLSDGLTDDLIMQLGRVHPERLRVIARSSAMRYRDHPEPIAAMGRELGVDYVLEGSARREGSRVRINATLIQVRAGTQLWAQSFDRELAGILTLQHDVARGVAGALALTLLPAERDRLAAARQVNPAAYEAYLMGLSRVRRLTPADLDRALEYFETAVKLDPEFARAHLGVGSVWVSRRQIGLITREQEGSRSRDALKRALALDPLLPEGHMALGNGATWEDWDWAAAEPHFQRALDLNPSLAEAHAFYSHYLYITGRPAEGDAEIQRALELDPLNDLIQQFYGMTLRFSRRFDESISHAQTVLKTNPTSPSAWGALVESYYKLGRLDESLAAQREVFGARPAPDIEAALSRGYAEGGYREAMRRAAEVQAARNLAWVAAQSYIRAGEHGRGLDWLERAYETRNTNLPYISVAPVFDAVRSEPRFRALLQRMKLS